MTLRSVGPVGLVFVALRRLYSCNQVQCTSSAVSNAFAPHPDGRGWRAFAGGAWVERSGFRLVDSQRLEQVVKDLVVGGDTVPFFLRNKIESRSLKRGGAVRRTPRPARSRPLATRLTVLALIGSPSTGRRAWAILRVEIPRTKQAKIIRSTWPTRRA